MYFRVAEASSSVFFCFFFCACRFQVCLEGLAGCNIPEKSALNATSFLFPSPGVPEFSHRRGGLELFLDILQECAQDVAVDQ